MQRIDKGKMLRRAAASGNLEAVREALSEHDSRYFIDNPSTNGNTALLWAVISANPMHSYHRVNGRYEAIINLLLKYGANDLVRNRNGHTVYEKKFGYTETTGPTDCFCQPIFTALELFSREAKIIQKNLFARDPEVPQSEQTYQHLIRTSGLLLQTLFTLEIVRYFPPASTKIKVLSLGCGDAYEINALAKYCAYLGCELEYVGIDIAARSIEIAKASFRHLPNVQFHCLNAASVEDLTSRVEDDFDFGILRNADFTECQGYRDSFTAMVNSVFPRLLKDKAPLLCTFYNPVQSNLALKYSKLNEFYVKPERNCTTFPDNYWAAMSNSPDIHYTPDRVSAVMEL